MSNESFYVRFCLALVWETVLHIFYTRSTLGVWVAYGFDLSVLASTAVGRIRPVSCILRVLDVVIYWWLGTLCVCFSFVLRTSG